MNRLPALLVSALALASGCVMTESHWTPPAAGEDADFVFVNLKTGPRSAEKTDEQNQQIFAGHMANITRLADERKLVIAGPHGMQKHDTNLRGVFVFDVPTVEDARKLTETDPGVQSGVFVVEAHPLRASTVLRRIHDLDSVDKEAAVRDGKPAGPGSNVRGYVMVTARDAAQAEIALADLAAQGKVIWSGRFGGDLQGQGVFVLDAADVSAAQQMLGPALPRLGDCTLDSWWSTKVLASLPAERAASR